MSKTVIQIYKYGCSDCEFKTDCHTSLRKHKEIHHDNEGAVYRCHLCESILKNSDQLSKHIKSLHSQEVFKCKLCGFPTNTQFNLKRHLNNIHNEKRELKDCPICGKKVKYLEKHYGRSHFSRVGKVKCKSCDFETDNPKVLTEHKKTHGTLLHCKNCSFETPYESKLRLHELKEISSTPKKHKCKYCDLSFSNMKDHNKHMIQNHKDKMMKYRCPSCDFVTHDKKYWVKHRKNVHKRIACEECDFSTIIKKEMTAHKNSLHVSKPGPIATPLKESREEKVSVKIEFSEELNHNDPIDPISLCPISSCAFFTKASDVVRKLEHVSSVHPVDALNENNWLVLY